MTNEAARSRQAPKNINNEASQPLQGLHLLGGVAVDDVLKPATVS